MQFTRTPNGPACIAMSCVSSVKLFLLTAKGARMKSDVTAAFYAPPPELLTLDAAELTALERLLERLRSSAR